MTAKPPRTEAFRALTDDESRSIVELAIVCPHCSSDSLYEMGLAERTERLLPNRARIVAHESVGWCPTCGTIAMVNVDAVVVAYCCSEPSP